MAAGRSTFWRALAVPALLLLLVAAGLGVPAVWPRRVHSFWQEPQAVSDGDTAWIVAIVEVRSTSVVGGDVPGQAAVPCIRFRAGRIERIAFLDVPDPSRGVGGLALTSGRLLLGRIDLAPGAELLAFDRATLEPVAGHRPHDPGALRSREGLPVGWLAGRDAPLDPFPGPVTSLRHDPPGATAIAGDAWWSGSIDGWELQTGFAPPAGLSVATHFEAGGRRYLVFVGRGPARLLIFELGDAGSLRRVAEVPGEALWAP